MTTTDSRVTKTGALKLGFAVLATAALSIGGLTPAFAADSQLGPDDVAGFEDGNEGTDFYNYDQWHIGSTTNSESQVTEWLEFNECSVSILPSPAGADYTTQVLKGYPVDGRPSTTEDIRAAIESVLVDVEEGAVTIQLPFSNSHGVWQGTVRNSSPFSTGEHSLLGGTELIGTGGLNPANVDLLFEELNNPDTGYQLLGIGFTGSSGAVVNSISFAGDTYYFGTGDCLPEAQSGDDVDDSNGPSEVTAPAVPKKPVAVETGIA